MGRISNLVCIGFENMGKFRVKSPCVSFDTAILDTLNWENNTSSVPYYGFRHLWRIPVDIWWTVLFVSYPFICFSYYSPNPYWPLSLHFWSPKRGTMEYLFWAQIFDKDPSKDNPRTWGRSLDPSPLKEFAKIKFLQRWRRLI